MIAHEHITGGYKLSGTDTFRRSCSKVLGTYGINMQNPSASLMRCVVPPDNHVFINVDMSGAEALIVAMEAPRGKFRELFDVGIKVHSYMALQLFLDKFRHDHPREHYSFIQPKELAALPECKELLKEIKNSPREYDLGKRVIHAKSYGMGPTVFRMNCLELSEGTVNLSHQESKAFLAAHEKIFPEIIQWQARIKGEAAATRTLKNLLGYPKYFGGIWNDGLERRLFAFVPQSTVGIISALALTDTWNYLKKHKLPWFLAGEKHDSIMISVPDTSEHIEHGSAVVKKFMERDLVSSRGEAFRMKIGLSIGRNWAKYDKDSNPQGMKELD